MQILDKAITPEGIEIELIDLKQSQRKHFHQTRDGTHRMESLPIEKSA